MNILFKDEIKKSIMNCKPSKIAVAYIGEDWKRFIEKGYDQIETIIISPTFGTNPRAVSDLAKHIGWDKIHFLNELHAKIFIGSNSAIIGSANLTNNGLSGNRLIELCAEIKEKDDLDKIDDVFENLLQMAKKQYPTMEKKKEQLKQLCRNWRAAISNRITSDSSSETVDFIDFDMENPDDFYVLWYQPDNVDYSDDIKAMESIIKDIVHFSSSDKPEENAWMLLWRITDNNKPDMRSGLCWRYIHEVIEMGVIDSECDYPKCAIQKINKPIPTPPFEITKEVDEAFKEAINDKEIAKYLIQNDKEKFSLEYSFKGAPLLINKMKEILNYV